MIGESAGRASGNEPRREALRRFERDERAARVGTPEDEVLEVVPRVKATTRVFTYVFTLVCAFGFSGIVAGPIGLACYLLGIGGGMLVVGLRQLATQRST